MLAQKQWEDLSTHIRGKLAALLDASVPFVENSTLRDQLDIPHKGFYIGVIDAKGEQVIRQGLLSEGLSNILESANSAISSIGDHFKQQNIPVSKVHTSSFYLTIIIEVTYIPDPLSWDESVDGVYFMWGQDYRAFYLPYEIQRMGDTKIQIMDKLVAYGTKLPCTLWKSPEGLCWSLKCFSHKS